MYISFHEPHRGDLQYPGGCLEFTGWPAFRLRHIQRHWRGHFELSVVRYRLGRRPRIRVVSRDAQCTLPNARKYQSGCAAVGCRYRQCIGHTSVACNATVVAGEQRVLRDLSQLDNCEWEDFRGVDDASTESEHHINVCVSTLGLHGGMCKIAHGHNNYNANWTFV